MASPSKIKLFETVAQLHNQGKVKLSSDERSRIESETQELIRRSVQNKMAAKAPEGFEQLLSGLKDADPDEAYIKIVDFMEEGGMLDKEDDAEKDDLEDIMDRDDSDSDDDEKDEKEDEKKPDMKEKKPDMKEKKPDMKEDKSDLSGKEDSEFDLAKKEILAQVKDMEKDLDEESPKKKIMPDMKDKGKGEGKDKKDMAPSIKDLQKDKRDKFKEPSKEEMGLEESESMVKAKKIKVAVTKDRNIIALHEDRGPLFYAVPNDAVKGDTESLRKAVNKVRAAILYEGVKKAASRCGARLLIADADDNIMFNFDKEVSPISKGVTEGDDTDTQMGHESGETNPLKDNDTDTREKPDTGETVIAGKQADVLEGGDTETRDQPEEPSSDATDEAATDTMDDHATPDSETLTGADTDYKEIQANYSKLYKARAEKMAKKANEQFVDKFNRCIRIASARMLINDYKNPFKEAAFDVLTADNVQLSDGDYFNPMDDGTAVEVIELIASESHDNFVRHLLGKAADLMEKSDEYLHDAEGDMKDRAPKMMPVASEKRSASTRRPDNHLQRAAAAGNMSFEVKGASESPKNNPVRDMVQASTKVGRTLDQYSRAGMKK